MNFIAFLRFKFRHSYRIVNTKTVNRTQFRLLNIMKNYAIENIWDCGKSSVSVECWRLLPRAYHTLFSVANAFFSCLLSAEYHQNRLNDCRVQEFWEILYNKLYLSQSCSRSSFLSSRVCFIKTNPFWNKGSKLKRNTKWSETGRFSSKFNVFLQFAVCHCHHHHHHCRHRHRFRCGCCLCCCCRRSFPFIFIADFSSHIHIFHFSRPPSLSASLFIDAFHSILLLFVVLAPILALFVCALGVTVVIVLMRKCAHI